MSKFLLLILTLFATLLSVIYFSNNNNNSSSGDKTLSDLGVKIPNILIPKNLDTETWSTIAVDQYTQDESYWNQVYEKVGDKPSTVKLVYPEIYLNAEDRPERIKKIHSEMKSYLENGIFGDSREEFVYLERTTKYGRIRHGLNIAIDLEAYEWKPFSTALIRATEATIESRLPPRIEIRKDAIIEVPHIMVLVNDPDNILIDGVGKRVTGNKPLYEGKLMLDSGSVKGWSVNSKEDIEYITKSLQTIARLNTQKDGSIFLLAVGDGNHSLATAKATWENYKKEHPGITDSNLRYAMIEIINIYDTGLTFEPIHRVLFDINSEEFVNFMKNKLGATIENLDNFEDFKSKIDSSKSDFGIIYVKNEKTEFTYMKTNINELLISQLQPAIDEFLTSVNKTSNIDYIHGADSILTLGSKEGNTAVYLPSIDKESFFSTISERGPLPRKAFSMGEADEKRFYLECRKIIDN